jgi:hypothetical protein
MQTLRKQLFWPGRFSSPFSGRSADDDMTTLFLLTLGALKKINRCHDLLPLGLIVFASSDKLTFRVFDLFFLIFYRSVLAQKFRRRKKKKF